MDQSVIPQPPDQSFYYVLASILGAGLLFLFWFIANNLIKKVDQISIVQAEHSEKHAVQNIVNETVKVKIETHSEALKRLERMDKNNAEEIADHIVAKLKYISNQ